MTDELTALEHKKLDEQDVRAQGSTEFSDAQQELEASPAQPDSELPVNQLDSESDVSFEEKDVLPAEEKTFTINDIIFTITSEGDNNTVSITGPRGYSGKLIVPATVRPDPDGPEYKVTEIPDSVFSSGYNLTSLDLSKASNLITIGNNAFNGCFNISGRLTIPSSVESIGPYAFSECSSFTSLDLSGASSLVSIGSMAFFSCSTLAGGLSVPESVESIGSDAFVFCRKLTSLDLSSASSLKTIGARAFSDCSSLAGGLTIPASVETLESYAFVDTQFDTITFAGTPANIGTNLFSLGATPNTSLTRITFRQGDAQQAWDENAFDGAPPSGTLVHREGATGFGVNEFGAPYLDDWVRGATPVITSASSASLIPDEYFSPSALSNTALSWKATDLPDEVSIDATSGELSVAESAQPNVFTFTLRATNLWGYDKQNFTLTIPDNTALISPSLDPALAFPSQEVPIDSSSHAAAEDTSSQRAPDPHLQTSVQDSCAQTAASDSRSRTSNVDSVSGSRADVAAFSLKPTDAPPAEDTILKVALPFIALGLGALVLIGSSTIGRLRNIKDARS